MAEPFIGDPAEFLRQLKPSIVIHARLMVAEWLTKNLPYAGSEMMSSYVARLAAARVVEDQLLAMFVQLKTTGSPSFVAAMEATAGEVAAELRVEVSAWREGKPRPPPTSPPSSGVDRG